MRMHFARLAPAALALALMWLLGAHPAGAAEPEYRIISPRDAAARSDFVVIDVREPFELAEELGYIEGARNIPLGKILAGAGLDDQFDKGAPILIVCRTGVRSAQAAAKAIQLGFGEVYSLDGGMIAWNQAGQKVIKAKADAKKATPQLNMVGIPCA